MISPSQQSTSNGEQVMVSLSDMIPLLLHATLTNKAWLGDFADDVVTIPRDLYEVLLAYQARLTPVAA